MMRAGVMGCIIYINFLFQTTLLRNAALFGVVPMTVMLIIVSYALLRGDVEGAIIGFFAGLLQDIFFMDYIGLYALLFALTGYFCGKPFKNFFTDNYILPVALTLLAMLAYGCIFYFVNFSLQGRLWDYFRTVIVPETIYTTLLIVPAYRLIFSVNRRLESYEKTRRNIF